MLAGLLLWNAALTYFIFNDPKQPRENSGSEPESVVVDYSNDLSEMAEDVRSSIVTVETWTSGIRHITSGIVYARDDSGVYVLTCDQSGYDEEGVRVIFDSSASVEAEYVAGDEDTGVCLLRVNPSFEVSLIRTASSSLVRQGEYAAVLGGRSPLSQSAPMSYGIVSRPSQRRIFAGSSWFATTIDFDGNVTGEMMGGPVLNIGGQMIGMMITRSYGGDRMGSAICSNELKILYDEMKENREVTRGALCVTVRSVSSMRAYEKSERNIKLDVTSGVMVTYIADNSEALNVLKEGDILMSMDTVQLSDESVLMQELYEHQPGDEVHFSILRNNETKEVSVILQ